MMTDRETIHYVYGVLTGLLMGVILFILTACSGHEPFEEHQKFLRESCLVSGGRWDNVSDECLEGK